MTTRKSHSARERIEALIPKESLDFYLSLYRKMKDLGPLTISGRDILDDLRKFKDQSEALFTKLKGNGYLTAEGKDRIVKAFQIFKNILVDELETSPEWQKAAGEHVLQPGPGVKKRFRGAPLSVLVWALYEDMKATGHRPGFKLISDFLIEQGIEYRGEDSEATRISDLYRSVNMVTIDIILWSYHVAIPENTLFSEMPKAYTGCLSDTIRDLLV